MLQVSNNINRRANGNKPSFGALKSPVKIPASLTDFFIKANKINTPTQRLVIGSSAMFLQPVIDLSNKKVDDKTRQTAASRSFSRAIIGTVSGIAVRVACFKIGDVFTQPGKNLHVAGLDTKQFKNYSRAVGNILSLGVLLFSNFLVDVPLINKMSAYVNKKVFGNESADVKNKNAKEVK